MCQPQRCLESAAGTFVAIELENRVARPDHGDAAIAAGTAVTIKIKPSDGNHRTLEQMREAAGHAQHAQNVAVWVLGKVAEALFDSTLSAVLQE